jgi:hypothetical protein
MKPLTMNYIFSLAVLFVVGILYDKYKMKNQSKEELDQYDLVKKFLLNESPLGYNNNKPLLWVHLVYDINSRWWASFYSRNTDCFNQPYQYLTIKSIIDKCGEDFNICLIEDNTFAKLLPNWTIDMRVVADPVRSKLRELAIAKLLYMYGGFAIPSSFFCFQSLKDMYEKGVGENGEKMFVSELIDRKSTSQLVNFFPSTKFMGAMKECEMLKEYTSYLESLISVDCTSESDFLGSSNRWCYDKITQGKINMGTADEFGVKDTHGKPITIETLLGNTFIELPAKAKGLYIPADEILRRTAFQWFARLSAKQVLDSDTMIGKYLLISR